MAADPRYGLVRPATVDLAAPASPATSFVPDPWANLPPAQQAQSAKGASTSGGASATAAG